MIFLFIFSTASSPIIIPLDSDEEFFDEYEYVDADKGEGPPLPLHLLPPVVIRLTRAVCPLPGGRRFLGPK